MATLHFPREREELTWFFGACEGTPGLRAAGLEFQGNVFDDAAADRMHAAMRHRARDAERLASIQRALSRTVYGGRLRMAFAPFGAALASYRLLDTIASQGVRLLGLVLDSPALLRLMRGDEHPTKAAQLEFLERDVSKMGRGNRIPNNHRLYAVVNAAADDVGAGLRAYAGVRKGVLAEDRAARATREASRQIDVSTWVRSLQSELELCS